MLQLTQRDTAHAVADYSARVNGVRIRYRESGDPAAPLAVVLHGLMGHAREWEPLSDALSKTFRVLAVDQRGHGESEWTNDYSLQAFADDALRLFEHMAAGPVSLIGHSMGGMVAINIAARRADLVAQLVLIDVGPESLGTQWGRVDLPARLDEMRDARFHTVDDAVAEWLAADPLADQRHVRRYLNHALVATHGGLVWGFDAKGLSTFPASVDPEQLWRDVSQIAAPTLVVRGAESTVLSAADSRQLIDELPGARLVEIADGGHDLAVQQPERVADAVTGFLASGPAFSP